MLKRRSKILKLSNRQYVNKKNDWKHLEINIKQKLEKINTKLKQCKGIQQRFQYLQLLEEQSQLIGRLEYIQHQKEVTKHTIDTTWSSYPYQESKRILKSGTQLNGQRLYPTSNNRRPRTIWERMSEDQEKMWKERRSAEMRYSVMYSGKTSVRKTNVDYCSECKVSCVIDREHARSYCPQCGEGGSIAVHLFEVKHRQKQKTTKPPPDTHTKKFLSQFSSAYTPPTLEVLDKLNKYYTNFHDRNSCKGRLSQAQLREFMNKIPGVPTSVKESSNRVMREIVADPIPFYQIEQLNDILHYRTLLLDTTSSSDCSTENTISRKSRPNTLLTRFIGLLIGLYQSRLFHNGKTTKNHIEHEKSMRAIIQQQIIQLQIDKTDCIQKQLKPKHSLQNMFDNMYPIS